MEYHPDEAWKTVRGWFMASAIWFVVAALGGFILASWMVAPELGLYNNISWLVFSRLRPVHTNTMIFGFAGSALMGAMFYYVPHLARTPLYSRRLGQITNWIWNLGVLVGNVALLMGYNQSREYAEYIWPVDIGILIAFILSFYNLLKTTQARKEKLLYVSIWYAFAAMIFMFWIYFFGNAVWNPRTGAITGMPDGTSPGSTAMGSWACS